MGRLENVTRITAVLAIGFTGIAALMGIGANLEAQTASDCAADSSTCAEAKTYFTTFGAIAIVLTLLAMVLAITVFIKTGAAGVEA